MSGFPRCSEREEASRFCQTHKRLYCAVRVLFSEGKEKEETKEGPTEI